MQMQTLDRFMSAGVRALTLAANHLDESRALELAADPHKLEAFIAQALGASSNDVGAGMPLQVNYDRPWEGRGRFSAKSNDITDDNFPILGIGTGVQVFEAKLVKSVSVDHLPWQLGRIEHLLAFDRQYPDEWKEGSIIAPGSIARYVGGGYFAPIIVTSDDKKGRGLHLSNLASGWPEERRYLVVRPVVAGSV